MKSRYLALTLLAVTLCTSFSGCAMCCAPFDCDFGYTGGAWVRDNPSWGRVGSAFEPAGYKVDTGEPAAAATEPTPAEPSPEPMLEDLPPAQTDMTSAPRLRRVDRYLPQE